MCEIKINRSDLAIFGGEPLFKESKSTSNLVKPDVNSFLSYSKKMFHSKIYTNNGGLLIELENRLARFHHATYCVAFNSGFWALALSIREFHIKGKTEVVIPSLTYRRLADIVCWAGLKPVFCDVDFNTLAVSRELIEPHLNSNTALVLAVHPIINTCDVHGISELCQEKSIPLLFDSVESVYETAKGDKIGGFGLGECFSLHASKFINGFEGGYLTTNDKFVYDRLKYLRAFGFDSPENIIGLGINAKMNEIHAAMALSCMDELESQVIKNKNIYRRYQCRLRDFPGVKLVEFVEHEKTSFKNILVEVTGVWKDKRDFIVSILNSEGILSRSYYDPPLHHKSIFTIEYTLDNTDFLSKKFILMPCGDHVSESDVDKIVDLLFFVYEHFYSVYSGVDVSILK